MRPTQEGDSLVPVWDIPVRVFHWLLVLLFAFSWWTGDNGKLDWHRWSGYGILVLVCFRIYWGFAGGSTARFANFVRGPGAVWKYSRMLLQRAGSHTAGHNPMGGWSVVAMLLLLLLQTVLGLFSVDVDGIESGPLADLVSFDTGRQLAVWHGKLVDLLLILIGLHLAAILYYVFYKRENLVAAMFSGVKRLPRGVGTPLSSVAVWRAMVGLIVICLLVAAVVTRLRF